MKRENTSKAIKLIMAFAIFWMVIGDLITYHQEKIFGTNYYEHHTPFTKPGSKDDGKTSHAKFSKDFDKQSFVKLDLVPTTAIYPFQHRGLRNGWLPNHTLCFVIFF